MNWGHGVTVFLLAFIGFIGSMVYYAFTKNADLVRDDYYESELVYDQTKQEKFNYMELGEFIEVEKNEQGIFFLFPEAVTKKSTGTIKFYRPDQKKYDRKFDLVLNDDNIQSLEYSNFVDGYYDVSVRWEDETDKGYIFESSIQF